jgi:hypothetical protein
VTTHPPLLITHRKVITLCMLDLHLALQADPASTDALASIARMREALSRLQAAIWAERDKAHAAEVAADVGWWWSPATGAIYHITRARHGAELYASRWTGEGDGPSPVDLDDIHFDGCRRLTEAEAEQRLGANA